MTVRHAVGGHSLAQASLIFLQKFILSRKQNVHLTVISQFCCPLDMLVHLEKEETRDLICYYVIIPSTAWKNDHVCG